jgi:hypothetical protein
MKIRSIFTIAVVSLLTVALTAGPASARRYHHHNHDRLKGVAIGVGAAILATALINHTKDYSYRVPEPCYVPPPPPQEYRQQGGHWEIRRQWFSPTYKRVWNPAHYDERGIWVEGAWIEVVDQPGYWTENRIWVTATVSDHWAGRGQY